MSGPDHISRLRSEAAISSRACPSIKQLATHKGGPGADISVGPRGEGGRAGLRVSVAALLSAAGAASRPHTYTHARL